MSTLFSGHYLRNRLTLGYIGIVQHKEHSPEVLSIPPGTPCIHTNVTLCSIKCKRKGKIHPITGHQGPKGE